MFSTDNHINFAISAKRIASRYGVTLQIDWEKCILDFKGEISEDACLRLIDEIIDLAKVYDIEELT
jgi:hypothetical protein